MAHRHSVTTILTIVLSSILASTLEGQTQTRQGSAPASTGVFVAGDYWDAITPDNLTPYTDNRWWREGGADALNNHTFIHLGNQNRTWNVPTTMWPGGWNYGQYWSHNMRIVEYNPDPTFYPSSPHSSPNSANYAFGTYGTNIPGAGDPARDYVRLTKWVDPNTRSQVIYEVGFPTSIGIDIKIVARQFTVNWANMNDFIIMEFTLKNTGVVDLNKDGVPDRTNNKINALCLGWNGTPMISYYLTSTGGRGNDFNVGRNAGYVGDNDPSGAPWDMVVSFPGVDPTRVKPDRTVDAGKYNLGVNGAQVLKSYTDVWTFNSFLSVKNGDGNPANPDKTTIFGTHPVGTSSQRGWYHSVIQGNGIGGFGADTPPTASTPEGLHKLFMSTWYQNGGKDNNAATQDFNPNPNFFMGGTTGLPLTFVPKADPARPNGDKKLYSDEVGVLAFAQGPWDNGKADSTTDYPAGFGTWTKGYIFEHTFGGDIMNAVGPFSLEVGESITIVWVEGGGYRLEGVQRSLMAARWAYQNAWIASPAGYNEAVLPTPPPAPEILVTPALGGMDIRWDSRAESDPLIKGYKIWRAQATPPLKLIDGGMRGLDRYQEQMDIGATKNEFLKPVNPKFDAYSEVETLISPGLWGPYQVLAEIPISQLATFTDPTGSYQYRYRDSTMIRGIKYWYYVSSYKEGTFTGPAGATTSRLESHKVNVNGRSGLWMGTYPFADSPSNTFLPTDSAGQKWLGLGRATPPESPTLISPHHTATGIALSPTLTWNASTGATSYRLQVSTDQNFGSTVYDQSNLTSTSQAMSGLLNNTTYYWRVSALNVAGMSGYATAWSFTTGVFPPPVSWNFVSNTGNNGTIAVPTAINPTTGTRALQTGDAVGVFFTRNDSLICAGYSLWQDGQNMAITAWGDNDQTAMKDGFASGELLRYKIWDAQACKELGAVVQYQTGGTTYLSNGIYMLSSLVGYASIAHGIRLPQGWNMISSFVAPKDSTLDSVFVKIKPRMVIAKNGGGKVYWPVLTINTIGKWRSKDGYQLYMQSTDTLTVTGDEITPQQVPLILSQGWSLVSYLRNGPMRSDSAVATLGSSLVIAKNGAGQVYWPALSINSIGNMKPGQGYQMYLSSGSTLTYPANLGPAPISVLTKTGIMAETQQEMIPEHYKVEKTETGSNAILLVKGIELKDGDEVGVKGANGKLIGSGVVKSNRAVIAVWGDNVLTDEEKEGAVEGESLVLMAWSKGENQERSISITSLTDGLTGQKVSNNLTFATDGVWEVEIGEVKQIPTVFSLEQNYPNPFNPSTVIRYGIPKDVRVRLEVYNVLGQKMITLVDTEQKAGYYEVVFQANNFSSGVYFYIILAGENKMTKKLTLIR